MALDEGRRGSAHEMDTATWLREFRAQWEQGQHVALIGPTGSGKTTIARDLLPVRDWVVVLAIKKHDDTLQSFRRHDAGYRVIEKWPPPYGVRRVVFWTKPADLADNSEQRVKVLTAMGEIYLAGGWCCYFDDLSYVCDQLGIRKPVVTFLNQGRSSGLSVVSACTRPRKVPTEAFNQCRHYCVFPFDDDEEVVRAGEIVGLGRARMRELLALLDAHDFLAISPGSITIVRNTRAPSPPSAASASAPRR